MIKLLIIILFSLHFFNAYSQSGSNHPVDITEWIEQPMPFSYYEQEKAIVNKDKWFVYAENSIVKARLMIDKGDSDLPSNIKSK